MDAGNRDEERAGDHLARVGGDARDRGHLGDFDVACVWDLVRGERAEKGGEVHSSGLCRSEVFDNPLTRLGNRFNAPFFADIFKLSYHRLL